jgi:hypothetical protein
MLEEFWWWENENEGWYTFTKPLEDFSIYLEMVDYILENFEKPHRHCRWTIINSNTMCFKFRYERNYIVFTLKWS